MITVAAIIKTEEYKETPHFFVAFQSSCAHDRIHAHIFAVGSCTTCFMLEPFLVTAEKALFQRFQLCLFWSDAAKWQACRRRNRHYTSRANVCECAYALRGNGLSWALKWTNWYTYTLCSGALIPRYVLEVGEIENFRRMPCWPTLAAERRRMVRSCRDTGLRH